MEVNFGRQDQLNHKELGVKFLKGGVSPSQDFKKPKFASSGLWRR